MDTSESTEASRSLPITTSDKSKQKVTAMKLFNLSSDKYSTNIICVYIEKTNDQDMGRLHPMYVGHILHKTLNVKNIISIKSVGRNRIKVQLKSASDANNLVNNKSLDAENLRAFIPNHLLEKKGLIRGVDTRFDIDYLKENIFSPSKIINIYRTNKKVQRENHVDLVPKQTIIVTFESNILPSSVIINSVICPVEQYIGRVTQCYKCLKFGHVASQCRGTTSLCIQCSKEKLEGHLCGETERFCMYCKTNDHSSIARTCPSYGKQKKIKKIMIEQNLSFSEAKQFAESSFSGITSNNIFNTLSENYDSDFPVLPRKSTKPNMPPSQPNFASGVSRRSLSQPSTSGCGLNANNNKKRKANISPTISPPTSPMFPFRFGIPSKFPSNPSNPTHRSPDVNINLFTEAFSKFFVSFVEGITSLGDLKNINTDKIKMDIKMALEEALNNSY